LAPAGSCSAHPLTALVNAQLRAAPAGRACAYAIATAGSNSAQRAMKSDTSMLFSCGFGNVWTNASTSRTLLGSTVSESRLKVAYVWRLPEWLNASLIFAMICWVELGTAD